MATLIVVRDKNGAVLAKLAPHSRNLSERLQAYMTPANSPVEVTSEYAPDDLPETIVAGWDLLGGRR